MRIPLTRGLFAVIDDSDAGLVSAHSWYANTAGRQGVFYARRGGPNRIFMHQLIVGAPAGSFVDHINGDTLDNRRANLRIATRSQNAANRHCPVGKTGFRGVHCPTPGWFRGQVTFNYKLYCGRRVRDPIQAARDYDALAIKFHGEFAILNFPQTTAAFSASVSA